MADTKNSFNIYKDTFSNTIFVAKPYTTAADVISVVTGSVKDHIKSLFPDNYFAYEYIDTSSMVGEQVRNDGNKVTDGVYRAVFPSLTISPRITLDSPIDGMNDNIYRAANNVHLLKQVDKNYPKVYGNYDDGTSLYFSTDHTGMNYDIKIRTEKYLDNMNLGYYLKSNVKFDLPRYMDSTPIEVEIPRTFVKAIASIAGINMDVIPNTIEYEETRALVDNLMSKYTAGDYKILRKRDARTNNDVYYARLKQNIIVKITADDMPATVNHGDGQDERDYPTALTVQVAFYMPSSFILAIKKPFDLSQIDDEVVLDKILNMNYPINIPDEQYAKLIYPDKTEVILKAVYKESFVCPNNTDMNEIKIGSTIESTLRQVIQYCNDKAISLDNIIYHGLKTANFPVPYAKMYTLDYNTMTITLNKPIRNTTYYFSMYVYPDNYDSILKAIRNGDQRFGTENLATLKLMADNVLYDLPVYKFKNKKEITAVTPKYITRVNTRFGPGYTPLVDEFITVNGVVNPNPEATPIKLCVGFDSASNPIVKCLKKQVTKE